MMKVEKLLLQFLGYLWYLIFFVVLIPALLYYMGASIDYLLFNKFLEWGINLGVANQFIEPFADLAAAAVFIVGAAIVIDTAALLWRDGDTFPFSVIAHKHARPQKLITHGLYRHIRHPMLLGYAIALIGVGIYLRSLTMVVWLVPLMVAVTLEYLVVTEEKSLTRWFGKEYQAYQQRTALILPKLL